MFKKTILSSLLAMAGLSAFAADYYVVAPLPGKQMLLDGISVALSATPLPTGVVGVAYQGFNLSAALQVNGDPAYSSANVGWSVVAGTLPAGLTLNKGVITGTPTAAGEQAFSVRATYKTKTGEQAYKILTFAVSVALATGTLPQGVAGVAYPTYDLKPLLAVQGDPSFNPANVVWTVVSNTLPAGLTLKANGTIAGTPTASGTGAVTARASYKGVTGEQTYQVVTLGITVNLAPSTLPQALVGQAYSYDAKSLLNVSGDAAYAGTGVVWTVVASTLPAGLTLKADGTISGTPSASGTGAVTARASYKGVNGQQTYQIVTLGVTVNLATATLPQGVGGVAYQTYDLKSQLNVAGDPSFNPANVTWTVVSSTLPAGLTLKSDGTLSGTPTASGTGAITARAAYRGINGEQTYQVVTLGLTVSLTTATLPQAIVGQAYPGYDLNALLNVTGDPSFNPASVTWSLVSSTLPSGLTPKADGTISGTPTASGTGTMVVRASYKGVNGEQTYQIVTLGITVSLAASTLPQGVVGVAYSTYDLKSQLNVAGDPGFNPANVTWTTVSSTLPAGLTLKADGTISGTPTASGTGAITARAAYRGINGEQTYQVVTLGLTVALATATLPQAIVGQAYPGYDLNALLNVTGEPSFNPASVTWSLVSSTLPSGLTPRADGTISGTPTASGTGTMVVRASYKGVGGEQTYQIVTLGLTVTLAANTLPQGVVGVAYSTYDLKSQLNVAGDPGFNPANVTWTVVSSTLPAGLALKADGTISGTPTTSGTGAVTARASYKGVNGEQTYQVVTLGITVSLATATLPAGVQGTAYSYDLKPQLTVAGDPGFAGAGVTWELASGTLPAGLSLNASTGVITGTPAAEGTSNFSARAAYRTITGEHAYQVVVGAITVSLAAGALPAATLAQAYNFDLKTKLTVAGDGAYVPGAGVAWTLASGTLPVGMSLGASGVITGTPTTASTKTFTAQAVYKTKVGQQSYSIEVPRHNIVLQAGGYRTWSDGTVATSCKAYLQSATNYAYAGATGTGVYRIQPPSMASMDVYCDMTTDGGGWTLTAWNKGNSGLANMPIAFMVSAVNPGNIANKSATNATSSVNVEAVSKALGTSDVMLIAGSYSATPIIENGQGVWSYDSPDCSGALGHSGRTAGCGNHGGNDNYDTADKFNIAIYPGNTAIVPGWLNSGQELCWSGSGWCNFEFYLR